MSVLTRRMPSFQGVAAGQTATANLTRGLRHHGLLISYSGVTLAQMNEIRVIANGKIIQRFIGGEVLDKMNQFDGRNAANGVLTIDFERYGLRTRAGAELTVIDTTKKDDNDPNAISTLSVEIDIDASATNPVLGIIKAKQSGAAANSNPFLKHVRVFGKDPSGAGEFEISDLPKMGSINRIFLLSPSAVINSIKLLRDGYEMFDRTKAENETVQADGVRVPQSNYYVIDFSEEGNGDDYLPIKEAQELQIKLDMAGAGHVDAIVEYIDTLN